MTDAQKDAQKKIFDLMMEHFSAGIVVLEFDVQDSDTKSQVICPYFGGYASAVGLLGIAKARLLRDEYQPVPES